jgi:hypothetical protein
MARQRAVADLRNVLDRIDKRFIGRGDKQKKLMRSLGLQTVDIIVERTRKGFGVKRVGGNRRKLKPLSKRYIEFRRRNRDKLGKAGRITKSNLTFTGQMLDSVKILKSTPGGFEVGPSGSRSDRKRNADVARWVTEQGRPFMNLGRKEIGSLVRYLREEFNQRALRI